MKNCRYAYSVGDINEDGIDERICLLKSTIIAWYKTLSLPLGTLHFTNRDECSNCKIKIAGVLK